MDGKMQVGCSWPVFGGGVCHSRQPLKVQLSTQKIMTLDDSAQGHLLFQVILILVLFGISLVGVDMSVFVDSVLTRNASFAFSTSNLSHGTGRAIFVRSFCPALPTKVTTVDWTRLNMLHTCSRAVNLQMSIPFDISIWAVVCNLWLQNLLAQCTFRTSKAYAVSSTILYSQKCREHWNDFQWFQWFPQPHYSIQTQMTQAIWHYPNSNHTVSDVDHDGVLQSLLQPRQPLGSFGGSAHSPLIQQPNNTINYHLSEPGYSNPWSMASCFVGPGMKCESNNILSI